MKILVFLLVLANLLFYAYSGGYLGKPEQPDAGRVAKQVQPERIRIISRGEEPPLPSRNGRPEAAAPAAPSAPAAPAAPVAPAAPAAEAAPVVSATKVCLAWEHLPAVDADRVNALIGSRFPAFTVSRRPDGGEGAGWWIYIPPLASKGEADKKAGELRQLGVTDYFIVPDGPNRLAISLGVFSAEKGGQDRLAELKGKGVRSARLMPRPGKDGTLSLQAEGPASAQAALLGALNGNLARPAVRDCP
ncbi:MAG TPA: hypothetical protein VF096_02805 [Azonexus sp.]